MVLHYMKFASNIGLCIIIIIIIIIIINIIIIIAITTPTTNTTTTMITITTNIVRYITAVTVVVKLLFVQFLIKKYISGISDILFVKRINPYRTNVENRASS